MDTFQHLQALLEQHHLNFIVKEHAPTPTSADSARERQEPLKIGAKALLLKQDTGFILAVIPADRQLDSKKLKVILNTRNLRFATKEELYEITGLVQGAVPPFGSLFNIPLIVDHAIQEEEYIAFNAGLLEKSIKMRTKEYILAAQPRFASFSVSKL